MGFHSVCCSALHHCEKISVGKQLDSWSHGVQSLMGDPVLGSQFHGVQSSVCDPVLGSWSYGVQSLVGVPVVFRFFARNTAGKRREAACYIAATMQKKRNKG